MTAGLESYQVLTEFWPNIPRIWRVMPNGGKFGVIWLGEMKEGLIKELALDKFFTPVKIRNSQSTLSSPE